MIANYTPKRRCRVCDELKELDQFQDRKTICFKCMWKQQKAKQQKGLIEVPEWLTKPLVKRGA